MKRKKRIHSGVCITDEHIVCVTAHIENKTMVITDALEMKRTGPIDEDVTKFIETYDLDEGAYRSKVYEILMHPLMLLIFGLFLFVIA